MELYLDTGVVAAYYLPDPRSREAESLVRATHQPAVSDLTEVELFAALARKVRRAELALDDCRRIQALVLSHLDNNLYARCPLRREHYRLAREWAGRGSEELAGRDALHLAVAALEGRTLATLDRGLAAAGRALGVAVLGGDEPVADTVHEPQPGGSAGGASGDDR